MRVRLQRVAFVGLGYVGLCSATAFAGRGFKVVGVDVDDKRVLEIGSGKVPFHEPGLPRSLNRALRSGRFKATTDVAEAGDACSIFITVGTPSSQDGSIDLTFVMDAIRQVGRVLRDTTNYRLVVIKSTVVPGTTLAAKSGLEAASGREVGDKIGLCANPEFLKEGSAIDDTLHPDKIVIGAFDENSAKALRRLYQTFHQGKLPPTIVTNPQTAELIKYASNAFLATKVSFINTIANICQHIPGVDVEEVARAIGLDPRIGSLFLKAGPGYGGSCFHKDLQALIRYSQEMGYEPRLLVGTEQVNADQAGRVVSLAEELVGDLNDRKVAILGLSFKKNTDDVREAASLRVIESLREKGARVIAYDPMAIPNAKRILPSTVEFAHKPEQALKGADLCILMTEWEEFRRITPETYIRHMRKLNLVDARRLYPPTDFHGLSFAAIGLGPSIKRSIPSLEARRPQSPCRHFRKGEVEPEG